MALKLHDPGGRSVPFISNSTKKTNMEAAEINSMSLEFFF